MTGHEDCQLWPDCKCGGHCECEPDITSGPSTFVVLSAAVAANFVIIAVLTGALVALTYGLAWFFLMATVAV